MRRCGAHSGDISCALRTSRSDAEWAIPGSLCEARVFARPPGSGDLIVARGHALRRTRLEFSFTERRHASP